VIEVTFKTGLVLVTAAAVSVLAPAATSATPKKLSFTASYAGTAVVQVTDQVADISATGKGTGTIIGAGTIAGKGTADASVQPCAPFTGPGTMTGPSGTKLVFTVTNGSQGCGDEQGQVFSLSGKANVTNGTGKLKKAHGTLRFTGVYDRGQGTFTVKFKGTLSL
jgi:hypothetical protein